MINDYWISTLHTFSSDILPLSLLRGQVEKVITFGVMTDEPFAVLWLTDAKELTTVDIDPKQIYDAELLRTTIQRRMSDSLEGRKIEFICADITSGLPELPESYHDLAFCRNTLYCLQDQPEKVQKAVDTMARLVRPGGIVIAIEFKFGANIEIEEVDFAGTKIPMPVITSRQIDISNYFKKAGLVDHTPAQLKENGWYLLFKKI